MTSLRHQSLLKAALTSLDYVSEALKNGIPEDLLSIDLMDAYRSLGLIIGEEAGDDLIDEIFGKFCMGK